LAIAAREWLSLNFLDRPHSAGIRWRNETSAVLTLRCLGHDSFGLRLSPGASRQYRLRRRPPITIKGAVTEFVWSNPHCQIYLDVRDAKGKVVSWSVESQSPGILRRNGWSRDSIKPGDVIAVTLIPAKSGSPVGFSGEKLGKIVLPDGRILKMDQR